MIRNLRLIEYRVGEGQDHSYLLEKGQRSCLYVSHELFVTRVRSRYVS